jgi:hypothetical protein
MRLVGLGGRPVALVGHVHAPALEPVGEVVPQSEAGEAARPASLLLPLLQDLQQVLIFSPPDVHLNI